MSTRTFRSANIPSPRSTTQPTSPKPQGQKRRKSQKALAQPKKKKLTPSHKPNSYPKPRKSELTKSPTPATTPTHLTLTESLGDLFACPSHTFLLHACDTQGTWGAGIAAAFKRHYFSAFEVYRSHCAAHPSDELVGTTLLIPPQSTSVNGGKRAAKGRVEAEKWIGCLFTSAKRGKAKDSPEQILNATGHAVRDLLEQVREVKQAGKGQDVGEVWMPKINSGLFGVPWDFTKEVLEGIEVGEGDVKEISVIYREE